MSSSTSLSPEILIRPYQSIDHDFVLAHLLDVFRLDSPMFSSLDFTPDEARPFFEKFLSDATKADVSFVACLEKYGQSENPIVGCVLSAIQEPNAEEPLLSQMPLSSPKQKTFARFVDPLWSPVVEKLKSSRILELNVFSISKEYRRRNLCKRMVEMSVRKAIEEKSCEVALVLATSYKSQALLEEMGFETANMRMFDEYNRELGDDDRKMSMKDPLNTSGKTMMKKLK